MAGIQVQAPPRPDENPLVPPGTNPITFDTFAGINTNASRPGIEDNQLYWCDGWFPLGKNNLRTLYGVGDALYTADGGRTVVLFGFGNIVATPIMIVLLSDGSLIQVNTSTGIATVMGGPGTITNPGLNRFGFSQWGSEYIIIVADQDNGYWLWDGTALYGAGTIGPQVTITNGGTGYTVAPTISFTGGSGTGATAVAEVTNGIVTKITVTNPGSGYVVGDTVTVVITPVSGGTSAAATAKIMPFGIKGTWVETYQSRVWVGDGAKISFTAPASVIDFATSSGGGTFTSRDSFLRIRYVQGKQSNGFLYLVADSSENYISGVQTSGSPPTTTFTNQNADPQIGSPWAPTVGVYSRNILMANAFGVQVSYGGAVTKASEALDGFYASVPDFGNFIPSSAQAIIFGKKVWMLLLPVVDLVTQQQVNKLLMWNGQYWWTSQQDITLNFIASQEIDSVITAYGTNSLAIYPLFARPSIGFTKTVQSKLWDEPVGYHEQKGASRLWGIAQYYDEQATTLRISVDSDKATGEYPINYAGGAMTWTNNAGDPIEWENAGGDPIVWTSAGLGVVVFPVTAVGSNGALTGLTVATEAADVALISLKLQVETTGYNG